MLVVVRSERNSDTSDMMSTPVRWRAVELLRYWCVSRQSFCSQVLGILTVLQEGSQCHGYSTLRIPHCEILLIDHYRSSEPPKEMYLGGGGEREIERERDG